MKIRLGVATLCHLVLTIVSPAAAQIPLGDPFIVNTTTAGDRRSPDVAVGPDGRFVVVWRSEDQGGSGWGVFARWFDWDGTALTGEVHVNTYTAGNQSLPRVDGDGMGQFVIVWVDGTRGIIARRFDGTGGALSGETTVIASSAAYQSSVSAAADGTFVVTWLRGAAPDVVVEARRYSDTGLPIGDPFAVSTFTKLAWGEETAVKIRDDGSFLVVWGDGEEVFARRYDAAGTPAGAELQVSQLAPLSFISYDLDVGSDGAGEYRIFWATDINLEEVISMTRTVTTSGTLGALTNLGHPTCRLPGYSMVPSGDFIFTHFLDLGDLRGTRYDRNLSALSEFVIAPTPDYYLSGTALAHGGADSRELVAVWAEPPSGPIEWDVKARIFSGRIFSDGFESGGTGAWSGAT